MYVLRSPAHPVCSVSLLISIVGFPSCLPELLICNELLYDLLIVHVGYEVVLMGVLLLQLVGDMELQEQEVQLPDGTSRVQKSTVYIKKCRYLESSGCVGMCVNMCKVGLNSLLPVVMMYIRE